MVVSSSLDPGRPGAARHSIRASFTRRVAVPAGCLAVLWLLALAVALRLALAGRATAGGHGILISFGLLAVAGLAAIAAGAALTGSFGRGLARDLDALAAAAQQVAGLPAAAGPGERQTPEADAARLAAEATTTEVAQAAAAIASLRHRAAAATASESGLRDGLRQVFVSLAKRNQSLLQRQLRLIDTLEQKAADPAALADLFALDHLTTRMRRHAESLAILSGAAPARSWREPVPVIDVIRAAIAEVEDYQRVSVLTAAEDAVVGPAVADMIHLLAELIENAALYSPSGTQVEIRAGRVANGFAVEIDDRGLGIEPDQLREINQRLASPPDFDLADADRLGLFVGAKLAAKHGMRVSLRPSPYGGTSAIALMPNSIVAPGLFSQAGLRPDGEPQPEPPAPRPARLDLTSATALALTGRRAADPPEPAAQPVTASALLPAAAEPASPGGPPPEAAEVLPGAAISGTHAGLPRRTRQASLSPHLRDPASGRPPGPSAPPGTGPVARTPERARDLAASVQSAWQRSRADGPPGPPAGEPSAGAGAAGEPSAGKLPSRRKPAVEPDQPQTPNSEEAR
ncbi:MAG TPA: ATP-binding protein [Streptosporangiaceae bacterium]|nr:ATP-binding protein [Streptosporangiaceae bacterium]